MRYQHHQGINTIATWWYHQQMPRELLECQGLAFLLLKTNNVAWHSSVLTSITYETTSGIVQMTENSFLFCSTAVSPVPQYHGNKNRFSLEFSQSSRKFKNAVPIPLGLIGALEQAFTSGKHVRAINTPSSPTFI